jgi:hypothetical protein
MGWSVGVGDHKVMAVGVVSGYGMAKLR